MSDATIASKDSELLSMQILNRLTLIRSNFSFGLTFWALLRDPKTSESLHVHRIVVKADGIYAIPPGNSLHIPEGESFYELALAGPKARNFEHASREFMKLHLRVFVVEAFEELKAHCELGGHVGALKGSDWYQFARMVRNALAHDKNWRFKKYDRSILPVTWNGKTIDEAMDDTEMTWEFFDSYDALELWDVMFDFAKGVC